MSQNAPQIFPTSSTFTQVVADGNIANFNQRWIVWISGQTDRVSGKKPQKGLPGLWTEWQTYVGAWVLPNGQWKAGRNPLKNAEELFIAKGADY